MNSEMGHFCMHAGEKLLREDLDKFHMARMQEPELEHGAMETQNLENLYALSDEELSRRKLARAPTDRFGLGFSPWAMTTVGPDGVGRRKTPKECTDAF